MVVMERAIWEEQRTAPSERVKELREDLENRTKKHKLSKMKREHQYGNNSYTTNLGRLKMSHVMPNGLMRAPAGWKTYINDETIIQENVHLSHFI